MKMVDFLFIDVLKALVLIGFMRRLTAFREQNEEDDTVLNYFDELEIHPDAIGTKQNHFI